MVGLCYFCNVERFNEIINFGEKLAKLPKSTGPSDSYSGVYLLFVLWAVDSARP